ncbi:hypothetical protein B0O99DRAFT_505226 [Bisporella sp. PMI_857]|nr:hypothetical protein B0O99DRAFT_505226 [Bisporella sp. PMI_857]
MTDRTSSRRERDRGRDSRSRSPRRHHSHSNHRTRSPHRHQRHKTEATTPAVLPYSSRPLTKYDFSQFKPLFASYLDIQKQKILADLDETEAKGRWKSFIGKWNRGDLAEGWYDPATLQKTKDAPGQEWERVEKLAKSKASASTAKQEIEESDSDDSVGPALPGQEKRSSISKMGPRIPNLQDLELKREMEAEDRLACRDDMRNQRKHDRKLQKEALDEIAPRAEAGTRERQLEKKKELNEKMKSFREKSPGAAEVPDAELMGGGDGVGEYKKMKDNYERKKNERELRKEENLRARMAEREERFAEHRAKEEKTMEMLRALAKQNFG